MKYNLLGNTGLKVSELCLGTMTFGGKGMWTAIGTLPQTEVDILVKKSVDAGINFIDTANVYSEGLSEQLTGQAIRNLGLHRDDLVIATKVRSKMGDGPNQSGLTRKHILQQADESLKRLQLDYIDLYQIHGFDAITPFEETLHALDTLVNSGKVRYIGCSNLERELVPLLKDQQLGLMVWSPLAGGFLSGKYTRQQGAEDGRRTAFDFPPINKEKAYDIIDVMQAIATTKKVSVAQIALAWLLHQPVVSSIIIGAKRPEQLDDNIQATTVTLDAAELEQLDTASKLSPEYPGWMLERQGADRKA
jgi:aryl-alcohol dehydrogenase-like predicted oxidoreductase